MTHAQPADVRTGMAVPTIAAALVAIIVQDKMLNDVLPSWFPLAVVSVLLLYGGNRAARQRQYDVGLDIDQWESDDEQWLHADWLDEDRTAVLDETLEQLFKPLPPGEEWVPFPQA